MEEGGWVERRPDANDRRVRMVFADEKGARRLRQGQEHGVRPLRTPAMTGLSAEERETLDHGLRTICDNLSDGESACGGTQTGQERAG
jgi:MarR family transcriptional regulator for hemolysin